MLKTRLCAVVAALGPTVVIRADVVSFNFAGSLPSGHAAAATFTLNDAANTVAVRIENTIGSSGNNLDSRALTGLFWNMSENSLPWTGVTATHGVAVNNGSGYAPTQLWAFRGDLSSGATPFGTRFGLGAAGFGVFAPADMLAPGGPHPQPNGLDGGILSATGTTYTGQHQNPMFRSFVEFVFTVNAAFFAGGIHNISINGVGWQFGSGFEEPGINVVPLPPGAWAGLACLAGIAGFGVLRRRSLSRSGL